MQRRVERHGGEAIAVAEGVEQRPGHDLARSSRPESRIDIPRHEWTRDMRGTQRQIDRILRRTPASADEPQPTRDHLAIHG